MKSLLSTHVEICLWLQCGRANKQTGRTEYKTERKHVDNLLSILVIHVHIYTKWIKTIYGTELVDWVAMIIPEYIPSLLHTGLHAADTLKCFGRHKPIHTLMQQTKRCATDRFCRLPRLS